jgi:hypothetical protein
MIPKEDLARFGYKLNMNVSFKNKIFLYIFLLLTWNLASFLKFWCSYGYVKSQNIYMIFIFGYT